MCNRCGRSHSGECLQGRTRCFRCGQECHFTRDCRSAATSSPLEAISTAQGQTSGSHGPNRGGPETGEATSACSLVGEQVEEYPLEDSLVDHLEHRHVDLEVRLAEYIW